MRSVISIGNQDFISIRKNNCFYIDKTDFIREWWENQDSVTLITRPRRFGKTLNMSMIEYFFSINYSDLGQYFEGLSIWKKERFREIQGAYPVISLSFADIKATTYASARMSIIRKLVRLYSSFEFVRSSEILNEKDRAYFDSVGEGMSDDAAAVAVNYMSDYLSRYYGKKVIILLDEYDTPLQEAYVYGYWEELTAFIRSLFNSTFKTNPYMERGLLTGITRVSKESTEMEDLLNGGEICTELDEQVIFEQLGRKRGAIWSLLLASGYLKTTRHEMDRRTGKREYFLKITNHETLLMFEEMIESWFAEEDSAYGNFKEALLAGDLDYMNQFMNQVALQSFSSFDSGTKPSENLEPERFYHGFVLGLIVDLAGKYHITSNRESGFGRYDVVMEPLQKQFDAIVMEFKVQNPAKEENLQETVQNALLQIEEKNYDTELLARGIPKLKIRHYGFAFCGKKVLIGTDK